MNSEDDLLFNAKTPKAKFKGAKADAATRKRESAAVESMDMAELIGSGGSESSGTGLDFGNLPTTPAPVVEAPKPTPTATFKAPRPAAARKPKQRSAKPVPQHRKGGLFGWLLRLLGRG